MDYLAQLRTIIARRLWPLLLLENALLIAGCLAAVHWHLNLTIVIPAAIIVAIGLSYIILAVASKLFTQPLAAIWQGVLHLSPSEQGTAAPNLDRLSVGRELVSNLLGQIYQFVNVTEQTAASTKAETLDINRNFVAENLPLPLMILDNTETITFANHAAAEYIGTTPTDLIGKNVYMVLDMSFPSEDTFDKWLKTAKTSAATATNTWERIRLSVRDNHPTRLFDLAAYYNRGNAQNLTTMVVLFDHTEQYSQDDQAISFVALSVHELRTPLTLLRGYIEVFEEELADKVDPELRDFMLKMRASAQQLMAFVNNILNVARVEEDQLELRLQEENWGQLLQSALDNLSLRAEVRGIKLELTVAPDLPTVGVDRLSIYEVINNLIDNAIKYSGTSKVIKVNTALAKDGLVETTIQDFGEGIPASIMPNLFTKFYRNHRNRSQIGGTGLGLYLSKAIVAAHGGNLWVRSREGQGSTFGFTILPFEQAKDRGKPGDDIVRSAHGWIKNHSLYRR